MPKSKTAGFEPAFVSWGGSGPSPFEARALPAHLRVTERGRKQKRQAFGPPLLFRWIAGSSPAMTEERNRGPGSAVQHFVLRRARDKRS